MVPVGTVVATGLVVTTGIVVTDGRVGTVDVFGGEVVVATTTVELVATEVLVVTTDVDVESASVVSTPGAIVGRLESGASSLNSTLRHSPGSPPGALPNT